MHQHFFFAVSFLCINHRCWWLFFPCDLLMFGCAAPSNQLPCTESRVGCQIEEFEIVKRCIAFIKSIEELIKFWTREVIFMVGFTPCSFSNLHIICKLHCWCFSSSATNKSRTANQPEKENILIIKINEIKIQLFSSNYT